MKCHNCKGYHSLGEVCTYDGSQTSQNYFPKLITLQKPFHLELESPRLNILDSVSNFKRNDYNDYGNYIQEPVVPKTSYLDYTLPVPQPVLPPPEPVYQISNFERNQIGWKSPLDNVIRTGVGCNGTRLTVDVGGYVRDQLDRPIGQMGMLNTIQPMSLPQIQGYGPPQADMQAWMPGYSPIGPGA